MGPGELKIDNHNMEQINSEVIFKPNIFLKWW